MTRDYAAPDWRGLCEELVEALASTGEAASGSFAALLDRARAALAQPEPEVAGPTDEELLELYPATMVDQEDAFAFARAVLARWGRPAPAPVPVAVSERLPGPEDCDAEGRCWLFSKVESEWRLIDAGNPGVPHLKYCFSHWLPAHALPLPSGEVE